MLPDRVSNPGPLTYKSGALPIALRGPAIENDIYYLEKVGKPSETDSIKSQISSKKSRGKQDSTKKDAIKDITSDSQVNSYFPYRWSPASLTFYIYFYLFLYLYII